MTNESLYLFDTISFSINTAAPAEIIEVAASPAIEGGDIFISCTIVNMFTDHEVYCQNNF